jgi:MFS transporter, OFA family, oxalate/formate antiporter
MLKNAPVQGAPRRQLFYGWVIVAVCALICALVFGFMYSYGVFFKPLANFFQADRASVSLVFSISMIAGSGIAILLGWLADRFSAGRLLALCGLLIGVGLILSSRVQTLWQLFLSFGLIVAVGLQGAFGIAAALVSRWFKQNRGLALGVMASGSGLGVFLIVPLCERLINAYDWSVTFIIAGCVAGILIIALSFLLRPAPRSLPAGESKSDRVSRINAGRTTPDSGMSLKRAVTNRIFIAIMVAYALFAFSVQIILIHLVNYATDTGISPLVATTFVSVIGIVSIAGRLSSGVIAEKIGAHETLMLARGLLVIAFVCLMLIKSLWGFYLFAALFGIAFGGEVVASTVFTSVYFGTKSMAALINFYGFFIGIGGALGAWVAGKIFDNTQSYHWAFITGAAVALASLTTILLLKIQDRRAAAARAGSVS